jgi:hypothetical protein
VSGWANTLVSGLVGIVGVLVGALAQSKVERLKERRERRYVPAARMAESLRGAATSIDYLVRGMDGEHAIEPNAWEQAKHFVWEADAMRAGIEFAFPAGSGVFGQATTAVTRLKDSLQLARTVSGHERTEYDASELTKAQGDSEAAIEGFIHQAQQLTGDG